MIEPTKDAYLQPFQKLLPRGIAIPRTLGSTLSKLLRGLVGVFVLVHRRATDLLNEMDPRGALEQLPDWESFAGLPDGCSLEEGTTSERRVAVVAKLTSVGNATVQYYIDLCASLGYAAATMTEFTAARFSRRRFGERFGKKEWQFAWQLNLPGARIANARFGDRFGTRFKYGGDAVLECRIAKLKPGHNTVIFNYGAS
jgi:uncharacterized protein YmfQ (DUF2313 family)